MIAYKIEEHASRYVHSMLNYLDPKEFDHLVKQHFFTTTRLSHIITAYKVPKNKGKYRVKNIG